VDFRKIRLHPRYLSDILVPVLVTMAAAQPNGSRVNGEGTNAQINLNHVQGNVVVTSFQIPNMGVHFQM
jgi:hypothetical protein